MSAYVGDYIVGSTVRKMWNSNAVAGESITRATNGTISVYKDGNTTQSTSGVTDTEDFDSLTGVHFVAIDTSSDGTFYSAGSDFEVVLSASTIDGKTINATLFSFSLENRADTKARTEPGTGAPPVSTSPQVKIGYLYKAFRNRKTQTATQFSLFADDGTTVHQKATVSDDGTEFDFEEIVAGP